MKERAVLFGDNGSMLGIVTEPDKASNGSRPAAIILNAGIVHRVGPHRNSVRIARRLAEEGFVALRFDLAGIGDSEPRRDALSFEQGACDDVRQAMDHLQAARGITQFVVMGLCSGADNSFQVALRDDRVVGAVLMDGYAYRTRGFYLRYLRKRLFRPRSWVTLANLIGTKLHKRIKQRAGSDEAVVAESVGPVAQYVREFPPKEEVAKGYRSLIERGVKLHLIFSQGMLQYYNYRQQLSDSFPTVDFRGQMKLSYFADANHTFTELRNQSALNDAIADWMVSSF